ncbi:hypothetical protein N0V83_003581 [Neocucurbitaria cava]|uniref:Uncharacterized protein n=1 Tax=Neocucurbitaria cava TaxID=798079 RepID=A0A9W8YC04_9PLEO|nr:hypothetical protein N0V83_003581 [Neocucurbitaria cava]
MVSTRRSTANDASTNGMSKPNTSNRADDTIHVLVPSKTPSTPTALKLASTAPKLARPGSISEHDLSLTSTPVHDSSDKVTMSTPTQENKLPSKNNNESSSILQTLALRPASVSGGALNPIVVTDSPPRFRRPQAPKKKQKRQTEPHRFMDNGYRNLYSHRPLRPALAATHANRSTFTGHKSHDIYRMMSAKMAAVPRRDEDRTATYRAFRDFDVRHPILAQHLVRYPVVQYQQPGPYIQYSNQGAPAAAVHRPVPAQNEATLRKKAVQYVREYSRPSPRKRRLSDADPDETSTSEFEETQTSISSHSSPVKSTTRRPKLVPPSLLSLSSSPLTSTASGSKLTISQDRSKFTTTTADSDPNFDINQLTEHTSLITSLFQAYPHSTDQRGLREDIAMLVSVQNQRMRAWMKSEKQLARKRKQSEADSGAITTTATSGVFSSHLHVDGTVDEPSVASDEDLAVVMEEALQRHRRLEHEQEKRKERDEEMRQLFSSTAEMWQGGSSGETLADVYANESDASSVVGSSDSMITCEDGGAWSPAARKGRGFGFGFSFEGVGYDGGVE